MKYAILVGDGMADWPIDELGDKTPLEASRKPNMDWIAKNGLGGLSVTIPKGMEPGSDVANMSLLGYNPKVYYSGRGPFEALSCGITLNDDEIAFRCNFVNVTNNVMVDYSAGHIKTEESDVFIKALNKELAGKGIKFHTGISYRNIMIIKKDLLEDGKEKLQCTPPHDIFGKKIDEYLPKGRGAEKIFSLMQKSIEILSKCKNTNSDLKIKNHSANMIWLWGYGGKPTLPLFKDRFGVTGGIISAVGLLKGIGKSIGMEVIDVPGATGYYDTDYSAKARYAIDALKHLDLIFVHVEAPDEAGHNGDLKNKILAIENFDQKVVGPILDFLRSQGEYRILIAPDHPTPVKIRTHTDESVPFAICGMGISADNMQAFTEKEAKKGSYSKIEGYKLGEILCRR